MSNSNILDFITIAAEYCAFTEQAEKKSKQDFFSISQKLLTALYLKASTLQTDDCDDNFLDQFVTEDDWNFIESTISKKLGEHNSIISMLEPDNYINGETMQVTISECFADIYQDLRDFIERYNIENNETQTIALYECILQFKTYWGPRVVFLIAEIHNILYSPHVYLKDE
jgi:hypothetical protein